MIANAICLFQCKVVIILLGAHTHTHKLVHTFTQIFERKWVSVLLLCRCVYSIVRTKHRPIVIILMHLINVRFRLNSSHHQTASARFDLVEERKFSRAPQVHTANKNHAHTHHTLACNETSAIHKFMCVQIVKHRIGNECESEMPIVNHIFCPCNSVCYCALVASSFFPFDG